MAIHRTGYAVNTGRRTPLGHGKRRAHGRSRPPYSVSWLPSVPIIILTSSTWNLAVFAAFPDMTTGHEATLINKNKVRNTLMLLKIWLGLSYK